MPERVNEALDPDVVVCFPYLSSVTAGSAFELEVRVTNHGPRPEDAEVGAGRATGLGDRARGRDGHDRCGMRPPRSPFTIRVPADEPPGRRVLPADLTLGERRYGQRAEAIVDIVAGA